MNSLGGTSFLCLTLIIEVMIVYKSIIFKYIYIFLLTGWRIGYIIKYIK